MQKIPTLFLRDSANPKYVTREVHPDCGWVLEGLGTPTRKYDGTCVMLDDNGEWWARREVKRGKAAPANYVPVGTDPNTGKTMGWEPIGQSAFAKFHAECGPFGDMSSGTYELCGPKINRNPEGYDTHVLIRHADVVVFAGVPLDWDGLRGWLSERPYEGIVWHHEDGRMAKLKKRDFPEES